MPTSEPEHREGVRYFALRGLAMFFCEQEDRPATMSKEAKQVQSVQVFGRKVRACAVTINAPVFAAIVSLILSICTTRCSVMRWL